MSKSNLWTKDFLIISVSNFFIYFTFYLLMVTSTVYATDKFNGTPSQAGLASGIFVIGTLVARLIAGRFINKIGWKSTLYIGAILFLLTTFFYYFVTGLNSLYTLRFINGAAYGIASTATGTIVAKIIPHERHGEGIGYYGLSITLAGALGPFLGMSLRSAGFNTTFTLCIVLLVISLISIFFLRVPKVEAIPEDNVGGKFSLHNYFEVKSLPIAIIGFLIAFGYSSILSFLTPYTQEINLVEVGSFFFIVYVIVIFLSRPYTGKMFDIKGENSVIYPAIFLFAIALLVLSQSINGFMLLLSGALVGLGFSTFVSSAQAVAIKVAPRHRVGLATSTFFIFLDGGIGVGPFILGLLIPVIGYRSLYVCMAIVVFACLILYFLLHGRKAVKQQKISNITDSI